MKFQVRGDYPRPAIVLFVCTTCNQCQKERQLWKQKRPFSVSIVRSDRKIGANAVALLNRFQSISVKYWTVNFLTICPVIILNHLKSTDNSQNITWATHFIYKCFPIISSNAHVFGWVTSLLPPANEVAGRYVFQWSLSVLLSIGGTRVTTTYDALDITLQAFWTLDLTVQDPQPPPNPSPHPC